MKELLDQIYLFQRENLNYAGATKQRQKIVEQYLNARRSHKDQK